MEVVQPDESVRGHDPPLTYMKPTGRRQTCALEGGGPIFTVIEVTPHFGS